MKNIALIALLLSTPALAHVELGKYVGKGEDGTPCDFTVTNVSFTPNEEHPLNERVTVKLGDAEFTMQHLPIIDIPNKKIDFEHGVLTAAAGSANASMAFVLKMGDKGGKEGPDTMTFVWTDKDPNKSAAGSCHDLVKQQ